MGEIFPPSKVHMDQGTTRLRRLCVTGGAASQISFCLWKTFIAIQNITWISAGILHKKEDTTGIPVSLFLTYWGFPSDTGFVKKEKYRKPIAWRYFSLFYRRYRQICRKLSEGNWYRWEGFSVPVSVKRPRGIMHAHGNRNFSTHPQLHTCK